MTQVYPHACGETPGRRLSSGRSLGLSPRLWGNQHLRRAPAHHLRSIPTPVGKPPAKSRAISSTRVYPHACGETPPRLSALIFTTGLSPRLWGNRVKTMSERGWSWSIPTPVGKPGPPSIGRTHHEVYPHACGETASHLLIPTSTHGLSPRLWGNRREWSENQGRWRSIPTPVGKPRLSSLVDLQARVYPHACGETAAPCDA